MIPCVGCKNLQVRLRLLKQGHTDSGMSFSQACHLHTLLSWTRGQLRLLSLPSRYLPLVYTDGTLQSWIFYPKTLFLPLMISKAVNYQLFTSKPQRLSCFWTGLIRCDRAAMTLQLPRCTDYSHLICEFQVISSELCYTQGRSTRIPVLCSSCILGFIHPLPTFKTDCSPHLEDCLSLMRPKVSRQCSIGLLF